MLRRRHFDERLVVIVQEGEELVILALEQGIVFVIVALATIDGEAEPGLPDGIHPVNHRFGAKLLRLDAAFLVEHRVSEEPGSHALVEGGVGQQIASYLFDGEPVERQVPVESVDDPVAVGPDRAGRVFLVAIRVRVPGEVEPVAGPALAVSR